MKTIGRLIALVSLPFAALARGQTMPAAAPTTQLLYPVAPIVRLWPGDPPATQPFDETDKLTPRGKSTTVFDLRGVQHASLMVYPTTTTSTLAPAVIICPGGGYSFESMSLEGIDVAKRFNAEGVAAFVLRYRLPTYVAPAANELPVPQQDVLRALQVVRSRAAEFGVDPTRVGVVGFSAGGHLAATAATMFDEAPSFAARAQNDAASHVSARPDFAVLMYPVITMSKPTEHVGSQNALLGNGASAGVRERFSVELHVTDKTPPLFVVHAKDDNVVPVANAEMLDAAATAAGVPHELVLFDKGGHGFGLGSNAETRTWFAKCIEWMRGQKLLAPQP